MGCNLTVEEGIDCANAHRERLEDDLVIATRCDDGGRSEFKFGLDPRLSTCRESQAHRLRENVDSLGTVTHCALVSTLSHD